MLRDLAPGTVFASDYRVVCKLAQGGMGAVYEAEQLSTSKRRALKVMLPQLVADAGLRQRFEQEARIGARIPSHHIVEVVGAGVDAPTGMPWLAMELLEGETLDQAMRGRAGFSPAEVAEIFEQLGHALGAAHDAGVVHRDLKPENVFLARSMRAGRAKEVKVLDFGVAKIVAEGTQATTSAVGSPLWLSPEAMQGRALPASDVWALGLIAFEMLAGFNFWRATDAASPSLADVLREITTDPIPLASARAAHKGRSLPPGFDEWFQRCLARDPSARFRTAREAFAALVPVLATGGYATHPSFHPAAVIATPPPGSMAAPPYSMPVPPRPSASSWGAGTVLVVLFVVFALVGTGLWALMRIL